MSTHSPFPRPAFIVGITGHTDIPKEDEVHIKERLRTIFAWLRGDPSKTYPIPSDGKRTLGMGLRQTPIVVLSSLAPGADTLVVEVALEFNKTCETLAGGEPAICVRAPLPFVRELYRSATTFQVKVPGPNGEVVEEEATRKRQADFDLLCRHIEEQPPSSAGGRPEQRIFPVLLQNDLTGGPAFVPSIEMLTAVQQNDLEDKERRNLRYQAAGEYIAAYSNLLLALSDGQTRAANSSGTAAIVKAKIRGLTPGLLPVASSFTWADNGPVLKMFVRRQKKILLERNGVDAPPFRGPEWHQRPLEFRDPLELRPKDKLPNVNRRWKEAGARIFRCIAGNMERFNADGAATISDPKRMDRENRELEKMIGRPFDDQDPGTESLKEALGSVARVRRRAADLAADLEERSFSVMQGLLVFVFVSAVCLHLYSHGHPRVHAEEGELHWGERIRHVLLPVALVLAVLSGWWFRHFKHAKVESRRLDYRALGEGLRVQFYWCVAGLARSVASRYMQRQRSELDWIRSAMASLAFPFHRWSLRFVWQTMDSQARVLRAVLVGWVKEQAGYFKKAFHKNDTLHRRCHTFGLGSTWAGVLHAAALFAADLTEKHHHWGPALVQPLFVLSIVGAVVSILSLLLDYRRKHHASAQDDGGESHADCPSVSSAACLVWALGVVLLAILARFDADQMPSMEGCWSIVLGITLVVGASFLAWGEKRLYAEHARQYSGMASLFLAAHLRAGVGLRELDSLLKREKKAEAEACAAGADASKTAEKAKITAQAKAKIKEIQLLFFELGLEALDENAEWIILHRSRPLEPFVSG